MGFYRGKDVIKLAARPYTLALSYVCSLVIDRRRINAINIERFGIDMNRQSIESAFPLLVARFVTSILNILMAVPVCLRVTVKYSTNICTFYVHTFMPSA